VQSAAGATTASSNSHCSSREVMHCSDGVSYPAESHRYPADVAGQRGLLVRVAPQRDLRELELSWYLPSGVLTHSR
jgi:hypothetical protein